MSVVQGTAVTGAGDQQYQISRSLRFNSADSAYLNRTPASAGNRNKWTYSFWIKRSRLGALQTFIGAYSSGSVVDNIGFTSSDQFTFDIYSGSQIALKTTTQVFRDPSSWYHFVVVWDSGNATAGNRVKLYVNGSEITNFASSTNPSINANSSINNNVLQALGQQGDNTEYSNGYMTEVHFIDGSALDPTSFGEFNTDTGVWQPKKYTGTYGTNGFYLDFADNTSTTTLGYDAAGSNDWTLNNFSVTAGAGNDSLVDSPTRYGTDTGAGGEVRGNYCTLNPLDVSANTLSNGNLDITYATNSDTNRGGTIAVSTGKWYFEATVQAVGGTYAIIGVTSGVATATSLGSADYQYSYISSTGNKFNNGSSTAYGNTYTTGDVIGVALDMDNGKVWFSKNGTFQASGDPAAGTNQAFSGLSGSFSPAINARNNSIVNLNCGQRAFAYTAPSGFKALCTQNLPEPTIKDGGDYFDVSLYSGNNSTPRSITGLNFQPDWVWIKDRSSAYNHTLWDAVRGVGSNKGLSSNSTDPEGLGVALGSTAANGYVSALNSNGFEVTSGSSTNVYVNTSPDSYVAWNWKANGAGSTNTAGTITSTVSVNTTSGFSIVTYTGTGSAATVGHGLGAAPSMIIVKNRDAADAWQVYHAANTANPETDYLVLNTTAATADNANRWNDTLPTSTVFSIGNGVEVNTNTEKYVAYCFAPVAGYSAMSSFTGNGSADGPFIFTNHRPAFVLIKRTDTTSNWTILDFQREGYNVDNDPLFSNLNNAEGTTDLADLLSNGFKLRTTDASVNASGGTYIYMSLASNPFKYSLAR